MIDLNDLSVEYEELEKLYKVKHRCESICQWFLNEQGSIRMCANNLGLSKSLVHRYLHTYITQYFDEEYCQIIRILEWNKRHRTMPHKYWKGRPW